MQNLPSKPVVLSLIALALAVVLGLMYYFLFYKSGNPQEIVLHTYVCDDESFYFMRVDEGAVEIAGARYELVSEEGGMRYESDGPLAFTINDTTLRVSFKESGEVIASCEQGSIESTPILEVKNI